MIVLFSYLPMKKYSLIWIVWLCVLAIWIVVWIVMYPTAKISFFQKSTPSLLRYLPNNVDQVMMIEITPQTIEFLRQANQWFDQESFTQVLSSLTHLVIAQAPKWANDAYSVLLLAWNDGFSIDQVQALWLLYFDTGYESKHLEDNIWLYGDIESVAYFSDVTKPLTDEQDIKTVMAQAEKQQAAILFFSKPGEQLSNDPLTLAFAKKLQYTALFGTPTLEQSKWTLVMQFSGTNFKQSDEIFTPQHTDQLTDRTVLYLEGKNLLNTFWVSDTQFSLWFPLLLAQAFPWAENLLSLDQVNELYQAFNNQVGLIIDVTENTFWLWLHLRLGTSEAYDSLLSLQPARRALANVFIWSGNLLEKNGTDSWKLYADLSMSWNVEWGGTGDEAVLSGLLLPLLSLEKNSTSTTLSLLPADSKWTEIKQDLLYTTDSLMTFRYDPKPFIQGAWINPIIGNLVGQVEMLWTWALIGQIHIDENTQQLIITFETR